MVETILLSYRIIS